MKRDKKTLGGRPRLIIPRRLGKVDLYTTQQTDFALLRRIAYHMGVK
jgi:hypothetical protein